MRSINVHTKRALQTIPYVCSALFCLFSFVYLYFLQPDLVAQEQYFFSHGQTTYNHFLGAFLFTFVLLLLALLLHRILRLSAYFLSVAWIPSLYLIGIFTTMRFPAISTDTHEISYFLLCSIPVVFVLLLFLSRIFENNSLHASNFRSLLSANIFMMFIMFLIVGTIGNSSSRFHYEMRALRLANDAKFADALKVADGTLETTPLLTSIRAYSLSEQQMLGERLFHYPMPNTCQALLPVPNDTLRFIDISNKVYKHLGVYPYYQKTFSPKHFLQRAFENDSIRETPIIEYLLCAHLLDGDLPSFANLCVSVKDTSTQSSLEAHYAEALILYEHQTAKVDSFACVTDSIRNAFADFIYTKDSLNNFLSVEENCRRKYGKTYWFHYYFSR